MAAGKSPLQEPFAHAIDDHHFHFPGGTEFDVYAWSLEHLGFGLTKFMVLEVVAGVGCSFVFLPLAWNVRRHGYAKGRLANLLEAMLLFVRDEVAIPSIGKKDAHRFLPFLWSIFFFILFNNLLGMIPWLGSATAALGCTGALALCSFLMIHVSGVQKLGLAGYSKAFVPEVPKLLYVPMLGIEIIGHLIKPIILAVRLFVNMLAGHTVLYVILGFIVVIGPGFLYFVVTPMSILGNVLLSLLELFVAFLQAYVFTFLLAIFIGASVNPHH